MALRIVQLTDPHLLSSPGERLMGLEVGARFEAALQYAESLRPDVFFLTGDFCAHEPAQRVYRHLRPRLENLQRPCYLVAGNHDDPRLMRQALELPGRSDEPFYYETGISGHRFLMLDSSAGEIGEDQLNWLKQRLVADPRADIVMHHPPLPLGVRFMDSKYPLRSPDPLVHLLTQESAPKRRIFCGHYHSTRSLRYRNLEVYLCPPTSFHISPTAEDFEMVDRPPGLQLLAWDDEDNFSCTVHWAQLSEEAAVL